jgi:hypothetical protein
MLEKKIRDTPRYNAAKILETNSSSAMHGDFASQGPGNVSGPKIASVEDKRQAFGHVPIEKQSKIFLPSKGSVSQMVHSAEPKFSSSLAADPSTKASPPSSNLQS